MLDAELVAYPTGSAPTLKTCLALRGSAAGESGFFTADPSPDGSMSASLLIQQGVCDKRRLRALMAVESTDLGLLDVLPKGLVLVAFEFDEVRVDE